MTEPSTKAEIKTEIIGGIETTTVTYESGRLKTEEGQGRESFKEQKKQKDEEYAALKMIKDIIISEAGKGEIEYKKGEKIGVIIDRSNLKAIDIENKFKDYEARYHFFDDVSDEKANIEVLASEEREKIKQKKAIERKKNTLEKKFERQKKLIARKEGELNQVAEDEKTKKAKINQAILGIKKTIDKTEADIKRLDKIIDKLTEELKKPILIKTPKESLITSYQQLFWLCKLAQLHLKEPGGDEVAYENAYKILVLYGGKNPEETLDNFFKYLKNYILNSSKQLLLHDTFAAVTLPINKDGQSITLSAWRKLFKNKGAGIAIKLFAQADKIEAKKAEDSGLTVTHLSPDNLQDALKLQKLITYSRAEENEALTDLCIKYNIPEKDFNKCLELIKKQKGKDNLPPIRVHRLEKNNPDYWLVKLPNGDPIAYLLGKVVNDCQFIGGETERCVIDGVTRENHGFYVLLKNKKKEDNDPIKNDGKIDYEKYEIVGQGYAWLSYANNLVFDSWENLRPESEDSIIIEMLPQFGLAMPKEQRVLVGRGGRTPNYFQQKPIIYTEQMKERDGYQYWDSRTKSVVYESEELLKYKQEVAEKFKNLELPLDINQLESKGRIEKFLKFIDDKKNLELVKTVLKTIEECWSMNEVGISAATLTYLYPEDLGKFYQDLETIKENDTFRTLTTTRAFSAYNYGVSLSDLVQPPLSSIVYYLIEEDTVECYKTGKIDFTDLKKINNPDVIRALVSYDAREAYKGGTVSFSDLKEINDANVICALVSHDAREAYESGKLSFSDMKDIKDEEMIRALAVMNGYGTDTVSLADLNDIKVKDAKVFSALVSYDAKEAYRSGKVNFSDLKGIKDHDVLCALVSHDAREAYRKGFLTFDDLKKFDSEKIEALVSDDATHAYFFNFVKFSDLKDITDAKIIRALVSHLALRAYGTKKVNLSDLKEIKDLDVIRALVSVDAIGAYETKKVSFSDLKEIKDLDIIRALVSEGARELYESLFVKLKDLKDITDPTIIRALVSPNARKAYWTGMVSFKKLKKLLLEGNQKEFDRLTSPEAISEYEKKLSERELNL